MNDFTSRRDFLKKSSALLGASALSVFAGCAAPADATATVATPVSATTEITADIEIPAHPYEYVELDPSVVEELAYNGYFEAGCCYGVAYALLTELSAKVGFPYTAIPPFMFANGKEGYGAGSLCGALGGAASIIGLCCAPEDAKTVTADLFKWYTTAELPIYQPEGDSGVSTVSKTVNCADSVTAFKEAASVEQADPIRKRRCGGVSGDVARKTVELLNVLYGYAEAEPEEPAVPEVLAENEYIGEAEGFGGTVKVKVTMDGDKIAKIDVLSHGETAGISDAAFDTVPDAIIAAQSPEVDIAAGATFSSKGIMGAVADALSKVGN